MNDCAAILIRPSDVDMSEGLELYCYNFTIRLLSYTSTPRSGRSSNVYHRFGGRVYSILHLSFSPPWNFIGVKKCEIWPRSSTSLFFQRPSFRNEATHSYQSIPFGAAMMELSKSDAVWLTPLWGVEFENPPWKLAKSSIAHPRIDRSR